MTSAGPLDPDEIDDLARRAQAGDTDCTTLTLTHTGVKGATGGGTTCW